MQICYILGYRKDRVYNASRKGPWGIIFFLLRTVGMYSYRNIIKIRKVRHVARHCKDRRKCSSIVAQYYWGVVVRSVKSLPGRIQIKSSKSLSEILIIATFSLPRRGEGRRGRAMRRKAREMRDGSKSTQLLHLLLGCLSFVFERRAIILFKQVRPELENWGPGRDVKSVRPLLYPHGREHKPAEVRTWALLIQSEIFPLIRVNNGTISKV